MKLYCNLYFSEGLKTEKKQKLVQKLLDERYSLSAHVLVLIKEGPNQLEFFNMALLYQKILHTEDMFVVGIAESYFDAICMVEDITKEVYEHTGTADIRSYILEQQRQYDDIIKTEE